MNPRHTLRHRLAYGVTAAAMLAVPACGSGGTAHLATYTATAPRAAIPIDKKELLYPAHKYYGVFVPGAPDNVTSITDKTNPNSVASMTGKQPNLDLFFQDWGKKSVNSAAGYTNFDTTGASNACAQGMLPMLTWESWDTTNISQNNPAGGVAYDQPKFSLYNIIHGHFDAYIKATADAIKALPCPIALRLDQEQNGYWYPWGLTTKWPSPDNQTTDPATPARYDVMWRHVWRIFQAEGATNVLWVWSPNFVIHAPKPGATTLAQSYPGNRYVDWVGIDGYYYNNASLTFASMFSLTIDQLKTFASSKPWLIAETGVGGTSLTAKDEAAQVKNLLTTVASRARFNGLIYFDKSNSDGDRANWLINQTSKMLAAFQLGIANPVYAAGKPGTRP
jgi:mannan endo-1,4-beta-mannosidase